MEKIIMNGNKFICLYNKDYEAYMTEDMSVVEVTTLPPYTSGRKSRYCILLDDGTWIFEKENYLSDCKDQEQLLLTKCRQDLIIQSKKNLEDYLETAKLTSSCHAKTPAEYSITLEKQQLLSSMILTATMTAQAGLPYQPSWNAAGEPCTYDWTLEELQQLAMEMEAFVRPLISRQQQMEVSIRKASTLEELENIDITF